MLEISISVLIAVTIFVWIVMPFAVFGINSTLKKILRELKIINTQGRKTKVDV